MHKMKSIYIISDDKKIGPLNFSDLIDHEINEKTLIWYEGKEDWQPASEILELKEFLQSKSFMNSIDVIPPNIDYLVDGNQRKAEEFIKVNKKLFLSYVLVILVIVITTFFLFFHFQKASEKENLLKEELIIKNNNKIRLLEDSIYRLNEMNANYEFMEYEKKLEEEIGKKQHQIMQLSNSVLEALENLSKAKKILKTAYENRDYGNVNDRIKDINFAKEEVEIWTNKVFQLEKELKKVETF
ncbi:GYF domain-containing protein [Flavobacterium jumunjinense]